MSMKQFFVLCVMGLFFLSSCEKFNPDSPKAIEFEDPIVLTALLEYPGVDANKDNVISYAEASKVRTLKDCFQNYRDRVYSFNELRYFVGLQTMERFCFNCTNLTSIVIPKNITSIEYNAFTYCENLASVEMLGPITEIGDNTFLDCYKLKAIKLPETLTSIGRAAFAYCKLESLSIPSAVTVLPQSLTLHADISSITLHGDVTIISSGAIYCDNLYLYTKTPPEISHGYSNSEWNSITARKIYVPKSAVETYKTEWPFFADKIEGHNLK